MASNIKWFKRAYRALNAGENQIWEVLKVKLSPERIKYLESIFMQIPEQTEEVKVTEAETVVETPTIQVASPKKSPPSKKISSVETKRTTKSKKPSSSVKKTTNKDSRRRKNERPTEQNN